jgi:hypothetical protein
MIIIQEELFGKCRTNYWTHTNGIVHPGFRGLRAFVARKKGRCKLIEKSPRNPARHHTIKR